MKTIVRNEPQWLKSMMKEFTNTLYNSFNIYFTTVIV